MIRNLNKLTPLVPLLKIKNLIHKIKWNQHSIIQRRT
jgi:hypothetical protein